LARVEGSSALLGGGWSKRRPKPDFHDFRRIGPIGQQVRRELAGIYMASSHDPRQQRMCACRNQGVADPDRPYGRIPVSSTAGGNVAPASAADAKASFEAGSPAMLYWPGLTIVASALVALAALTLQALLIRNWSAAAIVGGFFALFAWQGGIFFWRNRPGRYRPDAVPSHLLPRA